MPMDYKRGSERQRAAERQRRELEGDETYVMTRSADHSIFAKSSAFLDRYKILWYLLLGIGLALGFDFKTPRQFYAELQDQVKDQGKELREASRKLDALVTVRCLEDDIRDMVVAGIDCSKFANPSMVRPK